MGENRESAGLILDCSDCAMQGTTACDDCVVSYVLDGAEGALVFDVEQERALRSMSDAGLVPDIRFRRRSG